MIGKKCKYCGDKIKGRSDKRFCNTACKNSYNYEKRTHRKKIVKTIDAILHRNFEIIDAYFEGESRSHFKVSKLELTNKGFNFSYFTSTYINSQLKTYYYVYNYAWMEFTNQEIMLSKARKFKKKKIEIENYP